MDSILVSLFHSTLFLSVMGIFVFVILCVFKCKSPRTHAIVWGLVLLQGVICFRISFEFPVLEPVTPKEHPFVIVPPREETPLPVVEYYDAVILPEPITVTATPIVSVTPPVAKTEPPLIEKRFVISWTNVLFFTWLAGLCAVVIRQIILYVNMIFGLRKTVTPSGIAQQEWETLLRSRGISSGKIRLLLSDTMGPGLVKTPFFDAVVVPRPLWEETDFSMRQGILKHEISHFRHGDLLKSCVFRLIAMVHWFNPIAWFALRRFDDALEWRADSESFGTYEDGCVDFAKTLLVFRDTVPVTALCRRDFYGRNIIERSRRLLENTQNPYGDTLMKKTFVILCATILFLCGFIHVSLTPRTTAEETTVKIKETETEETQPVKIETETEKSESEPPKSLDPVMVKVHGKIILPDGSPPNQMDLLTTGRSETDTSAGSTCTSMSHSDGNFTINAFPNAKYMLSVFDPKGRYAAASQYYEVENETEYEKEIVFQMEEGVTIKGTVTRENSGEIVPDLEMSVLFYSKDDDLRYTFFKIKTDKNGKYRFAASKDQKMHVNIGSLPLHESMIIDESDPRKQLVKHVDFSEISNVNGVPTITLDFRVPNLFTARVLRSNGNPSAGTMVMITPPRPMTLPVTPSHFVTTDPDGYFRLSERPKNVYVSITEGLFLQEVYTNWLKNDWPESGVMEFRLQKPAGVRGRLVDSVTKKLLAKQLLLLERSSKEEPVRFDSMSHQTYTNDKGEFNVRDLVPNVRYELYIVPGRQKQYGGMPGSPRVTLATVIPEKPLDKIDLGDLEVDLSKAVVKEPPRIRHAVEDGPDGWRVSLFLDQSAKVRNGEKKSVMKIFVKKEAQPAVDYILENAEKEPFASFALYVVPFEKLSEEGQKKQDEAFQSEHIEFKGESLYLANDPILALEPEGIISLSQLRGESPSKWNVPKSDGEWKKTPGAVNPEILKKYLEDMLPKQQR